MRVIQRGSVTPSDAPPKTNVRMRKGVVPLAGAAPFPHRRPRLHEEFRRMTSHQILDPHHHRHLHIRAGADVALGDDMMACLAVPAEFRRLACEYPLLFQYNSAARSYSALALFGFEPGENLYVEKGEWHATCQPLAMAVQPFLVGKAPDGAGPAQVHIDMAHPRVLMDADGAADAIAVFDSNGQPTPYLDRMSDMLGALDAGYSAAPEFMAALQRYDLLEPFSMDVTLNNGARHRMVGYHLIHEEKLRSLEPGAVHELHTAGHLEPIFMALASLGNLAKLVRRKNQRRND